MHDWKMQNQKAGVENVGLENARSISPRELNV